MSEGFQRHLLLPESLLRRFADDDGRVMMERRDRARRLAAPVETAAAECGFYRVSSRGPRAARLDELLAEIEARGIAAIARTVEGAFPPSAGDRAHLSLLVALQLLVGRGHRDALAQAAEEVGALIAERLAGGGEGPEEGIEATLGETAAGAARRAGPSGEADVELHEEDAVTAVRLTEGPALARLVSARTWQLVRFTGRQLLTCETPVLLWRRQGTVRPGELGLGDEIRFPLDPRHALVIARRAQAGEVVRDLDERHAQALNRTVAEGARRWVFYHPGSDPLGEVSLAPL